MRSHARTTRAHAAAEAAARAGAPAVPAVVYDVLREPGTPLDAGTRAFFEPRFGADLSGVRIHHGATAAEAARAVHAEAFTVGDRVVLPTEPNRPSPLLAHELVHTVQHARGGNRSQSLSIDPPGSAAEHEATDLASRAFAGPVHPRVGISNAISRQPAPAPTGSSVMATADTQWLNPHASAKALTDKVKASLREIEAGKSVGFNRAAGLTNVTAAATAVGLSKTETQEAEDLWKWISNNPQQGKTFASKRARLYELLKSPISKLEEKFPKNQARYWLTSTPPDILDIIVKAADATLPPIQLYSIAAKEGLIDHLHRKLGGNPRAATSAQVSSFSAAPVDGFEILGTDDFWSDMNSTKTPAKNFLPPGYNLGAVQHQPKVNEQGRTVDSAKFPDLTSAMQGLAALVKRRRQLFLTDAAALGYSTPTDEESVYWTYMYYNVGENGSRRQLEKHKGKRTLSDWITKAEFKNADVFIKTYSMIKQMKIFP